MKKQLFLTITLLTVLPVFASKQESEPKFDSGYIKMATQGGLCGGFTLISNPDARVRVQSQRFSEALMSSTTKPGDVLSKWEELPAGGLRIGYDWAGSWPSDHYRVYCQRANERGNWMPVDCSKVVSIADVRHNKGCVVGPLGPSARYAPLNMTTGAKKAKN